MWMGHPMGLELTRVDLQGQFANHYPTRDTQNLVEVVPAWI